MRLRATTNAYFQRVHRRLRDRSPTVRSSGVGHRTWLRCRCERGQALVEFALALPLLLLLLTAILQFGSMYSTYEAITDAARTGARELAAAQGLTDACDLAVKQTLESTDGTVTLPASDVTPSYPNAPDSSGSSNPRDYCGEDSGGTPCTDYAYDTTCDTNGSEVEGDQAQMSISYPYTLNVFGMSLGTIHLSSSASDAIE